MLDSTRPARLSSTLPPIVVWLLAAGAAYTAEPIFRLPRDRDACFCSRAFTHTEYLVFRKNGMYTGVSRSHVGAIIYDDGRWKQDGQGIIELRSNVRLRNVQCGPLTIRVERVELLRALAALKADITSFLARTKAVSFSPQEIENAWEYRYQPIADSPELTLPFVAVTVAPGVKSIPRKNVEDLLQAWDNFLAHDEKNLYHATPVKFQAKTFLVSNDDPQFLCASVADVQKSLNTWATEASSPYFAYMMIPYAQYVDEIKRPQPFLFP
jgi:hypothetical protein